MSEHASRIFISYRREDAEHAAGRLAADLRRHFTPDQIFEDITSIDPGVDFERALQDALKMCAAVLVVIGPDWVTTIDDKGRRRLDDPDDWVRREVAESLALARVRVFPILVGNAGIPKSETLPEPLKALSRRQAFPLSVRHWEKDVATLIRHLEDVPGISAGKSRRSWKAVAAGAAVVVIAAAIAFAAFSNRGTRGDDSRRVTPQSANPAKVSTPTPSAAEKAVSVSKDARTSEVPRPAPNAAATVPTSAEPRRKAGEVFRDCDGCPEMVVVPAGSFQMGSPFPDPKRTDWEVPQHPVTFAKPFALGRFEVTKEQWNVCVEDGGCRYWEKDPGKRPIRVLWSRAQTFVSWLSKKTGKRYRLPSEAEWEYAARGGTTTRYPWGDDWALQRAQVGFYKVGSSEIDVGSFAPNAFGLFDMIGNLEEWMQDCFHRGYYAAPTNGDAWESRDCDERVLRGGGYGSPPDKARVTSRDSSPPDASGGQEGFRVARTL